MALSERLQFIRKQNHLSQESLAEISELSPQQIADWEEGKSSPVAEEIIKLAKGLEVSVGYLLGCDPCLECSAIIKSKDMHRKLWVGTTGLCVIGLLISIVAYSMWQTPLSLALGVILQAISIIVYEALTPSRIETAAMRARFYEVNIWLTAFAPSFIAAELVFRQLPFSYPKVAPFLVGVVLYPLLCTLFNSLLRHNK